MLYPGGPFSGGLPPPPRLFMGGAEGCPRRPLRVRVRGRVIGRGGGLFGLLEGVCTLQTAMKPGRKETIVVCSSDSVYEAEMELLITYLYISFLLAD